MWIRIETKYIIIIVGGGVLKNKLMNVDFMNNKFMWEILPINVFNDIHWLSLIFTFTY